MFTSQHKVHQVHKSTRYFHQSHTTFPQFIHLLNSIYPKQILHVFLQDWNTTDKISYYITELVLRCVEFDTYRVAISSNCIEFDTRFNVNKYITSLLVIKMLKTDKRVEALNHNYYYSINPFFFTNCYRYNSNKLNICHV